MCSLGVLQTQLLSTVVSALWQCRAIDLITLSVFFEAGRGNALFLNANMKQNNQCEVLTEESMDQLPSSFIAFSYFFSFLRGETQSHCLCFVLTAFLMFVKSVSIGCLSAQITDGVRYLATCQTSGKSARQNQCVWKVKTFLQ